MLTQKQLKEIREHLEKAQNPLFFYDNDADGLCSFTILARALGRGKGVAVKSYPGLDEGYLRKVNELNPDYIFILDKPRVEPEFISGVTEKAIPIVWIDHHNIQVEKESIKKVSYYNSYPSSEPVTFISQKIFNRKEDLWLAMTGCIGDVYMPDFAEEFTKDNPELFPEQATRNPAFDAMYTTEIGKLAQMLNFGLKDTTTNVVRLTKLLIGAKSAYDILHETAKTKHLHQRFNQLNQAHKKLVEKAEAQSEPESKLLFFTYSGDTSMSSELSNILRFRNRDKLIIVAYKNQEKANLSIRGSNARNITLKAIENIERARGGGHEKATGAQVPIDKLDEFKSNIKELVKERE